jgi:hypothetical protein
MALFPKIKQNTSQKITLAPSIPKIITKNNATHHEIQIEEKPQ